MNAIDTTITIAQRTRLTIGGIDRLTGIIIGETKSRSSSKEAAVKFFARAANSKGIEIEQLSGVIFAEDQETAEMNLSSAMNPTPPAQEPESATSSGRRSCFKNHRLWTKGDNPRAKETRAWHSMNIIIDNAGITFEEFKAKGGNTRDLLHDFRRDRITIKPVE